MLSASDEYKRAIVGTVRKISVKATVYIEDPDIQYGAVSSSEKSAYCHDKELTDKNTNNPPMFATLEKDRWKLDGSFKIYPTNPSESESSCFQTKNVCGADGVFENPQFLEIKFSGVQVLQECAVYFPDNSCDGVPEDFTVTIVENGVIRHEKSFTGNSDNFVTVKGFEVNNADTIRITVTKMSMPFRRFRCVEIIAGIFEHWSGDNLSEFRIRQHADVSNVTLPYGTCDIRVDNSDKRFDPRNKSGIFKSISERQPIDISMGVLLPDGSTEYKRVGVYYQYAGGWITSDNSQTMQWSLVDIIGLFTKREYIVPETLPTTLDGWVKSIVSQIGPKFDKRYHIDPDYKDLPLKAESDKITGMTCGNLLRFACMATGTFARADNKTGNLAIEPVWDQGNKITLDNLEKYPTMKANQDIAAVIFDLPDPDNAYPPLDLKCTVQGNSQTATKTVTINNPFITTIPKAKKFAKGIISAYGGSIIELVGRGDMTSEIGDVDTVWLDESDATTARRIEQEFIIKNGVMKGVKSMLLQADGVFNYEGRVEIKNSGTWKAPAGATRLRIIIVGHGEDGEDGTDGDWWVPGKDGKDGRGGNVWHQTVNINPEQEFSVNIGKNDTTFGPYSSADGHYYATGYTDVNSGKSYARTGNENAKKGSGDGGDGGQRGKSGKNHIDENGNVVIDQYPTKGWEGDPGASGCVVVYWDKVAENG